MAPHTTSKRLPISCEPCRKRKIRCARNGPPCETCLRRGLGPTQCVFLGQPKAGLGGNNASNQSQEELLQRIRNLEVLLRRHVGDHAVQQVDMMSQSGTSMSSSPEIELQNLESPKSPTSQLLQGVGSLNISPAGYVRFEPQSSTLTADVAQVSLKEYSDELNSNSRDDPCGFPFASKPPATRAELMAQLPPQQYSDLLKSIYFRVFSPLFHVLHDPSFEAEYSKFQENPDSVSLSWLALLYIVLAIAVNGLDETDPLLPDLGRQGSPIANMRVVSARYRATAMQCLAADDVMSRHSLHSLQTLVLLIYALTHSSQPCWVLIGMSHHVAISMGCHLDPDHFRLGIVEAEKRRRCWAALVMLHMTQKISFRNLDQQKLSRDVRLPIEADDDDLGDNKPIPLPSGPTQMTYLLFKFRMYDIACRICSEIFGLQQPSQKAVQQLDREIAAQQEAWNIKYHCDSKVTPLPNHHVAHMNILFGYSHQLFLLLHRPSLNRYLAGEVNSKTRASRNRCLESAKGLLSIQRTLTGSPEFAPYKWYTAGLASFHAFHAAVVLAVIMMSSDDAIEKEDIKHSLTDSVQTFRLLSSRSALCEKAVPILTRLIEYAATRHNTAPINPKAQQYSYPSPSSTTSTTSNIAKQDTQQYWQEQQQQQPPPPQQQQQFSSQGQSLDYSQVQVSPQYSNFTDPQTESIQAQLQAQYWLGPGGIAWANWNFLGNEQSGCSTEIVT